MEEVDFVGSHGFNPTVFPENTSQATQNTPKLSSPVGQRAYAIGAEFFRFHRDHILIYNQWLKRNKLPTIKGYLMTDTGAGGWPAEPTAIELGAGQCANLGDVG